MKKNILIILIFFSFISAYSQNSIVTKKNATDSLVQRVDTSQINSSVSEEKLLPEHYLMTQRLLWSENGLMRNFNSFKLSKESRNLEMNIRSITITAHEYLGYASLLGMVGTAITGQKLYKGDTKIKDLHEGIAGFTNVCYFSTAALGLFQPPPMHNRESGFTKLRIHRTLAVVHLTSMIATNVLSGMLERNEKLRPYHKAAAITAFSSLFLATVVIKI